LLEWNNLPPKIFARVNTLKIAPGKLLEKWREEDVDYDFVRRGFLNGPALEAVVFELKSHPPPASLESFRNGWFYIQDPGTLLAPLELAPQPGETILDLCAAPGGKTTFLAQLMNNTGQIIAGDVSDERLKLLRENCLRLGVTCVEPILNSERIKSSRVSSRNQTNRPSSQTIGGQFSLSPLGERVGVRGMVQGELGENLKLKIQNSKFDRILIDAPCSNTGVLRRRVDLRWRVTPDEISRLQQIQLDLLKTAAPQLKPGGVLVYSTCSLEPEENSVVIREFLRAHPNFKLEREYELLPFADNVDGAFVARLNLVS